MKFVYNTGIHRKLFHNVRLWGSWDSSGHYSEQWTEAPMTERRCADGSIVFEAEITFPPSEVGKRFSWNVLTDGPLGLDRAGITTEAPGAGHDALERSFELSEQSTEQRYYLTHVRRLGAQKVRVSDSGDFGLRFAVWAPNAQAVEVVFGDPGCGYIADDGTGIDANRPVLALEKGDDGVWLAGPWNTPALRRFADFVGAPYMYRIRNEQGEVTYRTDLHSRAQIGTGAQNPDGKPFSGPAVGAERCRELLGHRRHREGARQPGFGAPARDIR